MGYVFKEGGTLEPKVTGRKVTGRGLGAHGLRKHEKQSGMKDMVAWI